MSAQKLTKCNQFHNQLTWIQNGGRPAYLGEKGDTPEDLKSGRWPDVEQITIARFESREDWNFYVRKDNLQVKRQIGRFIRTGDRKLLGKILGYLYPLYPKQSCESRDDPINSPVTEYFLIWIVDGREHFREGCDEPISQDICIGKLRLLQKTLPGKEVELKLEETKITLIS